MTKKFGKIHQRRLLNVAKVVEDRIGEKPWREEDGTIVNPFTMLRYGWSCGTPACVLGTYASRKDVQRTFELAILGQENSRPFDACIRSVNAKPHYDDFLPQVIYSSQIVLDHFGIGVDEAYELFGSDGCGEAATPAAAARYIRKFVARKLSQEAKEARKKAAVKTRKGRSR